MKAVIIFTLITLGIFQQSDAQSYIPKIEPGACMIRTGPGVIARCGYLVVPENRKKPAGRVVKIPFVFVRKQDSDPRKGVSLHSTGGPGYSTIANFDSLSVNSASLQHGGFIIFDQRGTKRSQPSLDCPEIGEAIKKAYRENLPKDSMVLAVVKQSRARFIKQGIDLSAYNTIESAADINDLRLVLDVDSLNLIGISYSGGLMLTVARNHPEAVRSMILNSPLPGFVNYEEDGLLNINEALNQVFDNCEADSTGNPAYLNLRSRFQQYFSNITGKNFTMAYTEKGKKEPVNIQYTKKELLDVILNRLNANQLKSAPFVINELINGNHEPYVKKVLDAAFEGDQGLAHGMRYSVYCTEQIAYADRRLIKKQELLLPWLAGYAFNNVDHEICDCWKVTPEPEMVKTPVYTNIPALIASGDADPWCRPFYNRLIKRYMPNSQLLMMHNRGHVPRLKVDDTDFVKLFLEQPYRKIISPVKDVTVE